MEYVYAALLLHHAKKNITEEGLRSVLQSAGVEVDDIRVKALVAALKEVNIDEAIKSAALPMAPSAPLTAATTPPTTAEAEKKKVEKKEVEKKEVSEESLAEGLSALFG
ncbi:MAG: 50S ribosomal protein P1 [Candidatus Nezhaarchaeales archaeon]